MHIANIKYAFDISISNMEKYIKILTSSIKQNKKKFNKTGGYSMW